MDPDEALKQLRKWAAGVEEYVGREEGAAMLFEGLDDWLTRLKGYPPADWKPSNIVDEAAQEKISNE